MATLVLPFDAVQDKVTFVKSGTSIAERMHALRRLCRKALLTAAYYDLAAEQTELIGMLESGVVQHSDAHYLITVADKLDSLVTSTEQLLFHARHANFALWNGVLPHLAKNSEKLDSLAESFRMSASEQHVHYVGDLVERAAVETSSSEVNWRDFVATLHD